MAPPYILILYYSHQGHTRKLAQAIARGVILSDIDVKIRTVPKVSTVCESIEADIPESGDVYCELDDLRHCSGLVVGSPTRFGNMAAPMKYFWDSTAPLWLNGDLVNKPAGLFTSSTSYHGGQESTLLSMMLPLLHQGMVVTGIPYTEESLHKTQSGGSPYGASHVDKQSAAIELTKDEAELCLALGKRIAHLARKLCASERSE